TRTSIKGITNGAAEGRAGALTVYRGHVYVVAPALNEVWRLPIRQGGGEARIIPGVDAPTAIAAGAGYIWVASSSRGTVTRIAPDSLSMRTRTLPGHLGGIAVTHGRVWVSVQPAAAAAGMSETPAYAKQGQIVVAGRPVAAGDAPSWSSDGRRFVYTDGVHL